MIYNFIITVSDDNIIGVKEQVKERLEDIGKVNFIKISEETNNER